MQGLFIAGSRPRSKKQVKELVAGINAGDEDPFALVFEATSVFGNEYDGSLANAPKRSYTFVGPDPHTSRKFYLTIEWSTTKKEWIVK